MEMPKIDKRFEVFNKDENKEADIYLYGSIGSGWFADISSKDVKYQLSKLVDVKKINIHLNSGGGDVFESIAIHNLLKNHKAEVVVHIDGLAASGASVIAMSADKVIMPKNTMLMIHKAWTFASGNSADLRKIANDLDKIDTAVTESYTSRFVGEREELEQLLADETWLTAEEALALGLADEIIDEFKEETDPVAENSIKDTIVNKYQQNKIVAEVKNKEVHNDVEEQNEHKTEKLANAMFQFLNGFNTAKM